MARKKIAYDSEITEINHDYIDELQSIRNQSDRFYRLFDILVTYEEDGGQPGDKVYSLIEKMIERNWDKKDEYMIPEVHAFVEMFKRLESAKTSKEQHRAIHSLVNHTSKISLPYRFRFLLRKVRDRTRNRKRKIDKIEWLAIRHMRSKMLDRENEFIFLYKSTQKLLKSRYSSLLSKEEREDLVHEVILDRLAKADYNLALTVPQKIEFIKLTIKTQIDSYLSKRRTQNEYIQDERSFLIQSFPYMRRKKSRTAA